jgi:transposase
VLIVETGPVSERLRVREIDDDEGRRLVRTIRRGSGSVVTWRRARMVLLSAHGMDVPGIARVAFTSEDRVRDVIRNFNADGKTRSRFLEFCRYLRSLYPVTTRIAVICDNYSPHLSTARDGRVGAWAAASNVEIACTPSNASWLNRIEAQFTVLRYFALDGTGHASHKEQASMIRRYISWRNNHAYDEKLRRIVDRANVA